MDIVKALAKEHSRKGVNKVVDYVGDNKSRFKVLIEAFFTGPYRITQRAAWPLGVIGEAHPVLFKPYLRRLLKLMKQEAIHDAVKRNGFRILLFVDIPSFIQGELIDLCFNVVQTKTEAIAVRVFAMMVLDKLIIDYPELQRELRILIEEELPYAKPAFRSRGIKILKGLK